MNYLFFFILMLLSCSLKDKKEDNVENKANQYTNVSKNDKDFEVLEPFLYQQDTINAEQFGVKPDYNGKTGTDNRRALQDAIDYCSKNNKILRLPQGKILLNSHATTPAAKAHANILELKSNTKIIGNKSEIILGKTFHDKPFVLLSGLNAVATQDFVNISNVEIKNIIFNFNNKEVFMVSKYQLMRGIELGQCMNAEISNCTFMNGDLTSAIVTGQGNRNVSSDVKIFDNKFIELIKSAKNEDHTSVYLNSKNSSIYKNTFLNTSRQGKIVACAGELHNSNTSFYNNDIKGYLRMNFIVAGIIENQITSNIRIYNNTAYLTSAGVYLWTDDNAIISNIKITGNKIYSSHVDGASMAFNGTQGILADATVGKNTLIENILVENNQSTILKTNYSGRAVNFAFDKNRKFKNFNETNNDCKGCKDGKYYEAGIKWPF